VEVARAVPGTVVDIGQGRPLLGDRKNRTESVPGQGIAPSRQGARTFRTSQADVAYLGRRAREPCSLVRRRAPPCRSICLVRQANEPSRLRSANGGVSGASRRERPMENRARSGMVREGRESQTAALVLNACKGSGSSAPGRPRTDVSMGMVDAAGHRIVQHLSSHATTERGPRRSANSARTGGAIP